MRRRGAAAGGGAGETKAKAKATPKRTQRKQQIGVDNEEEEKEARYRLASSIGGGTKNRARMDAQFNRLTMQLNQLMGGASTGRAHDPLLFCA